MIYLGKCADNLNHKKGKTFGLNKIKFHSLKMERHHTGLSAPTEIINADGVEMSDKILVEFSNQSPSPMGLIGIRWDQGM